MNNVTRLLRTWWLLLGAVALAVGAAPAQAQRQKLFYAEFTVGSFLAAADPTSVPLVITNTSTEPATINTLVVCNAPGVTFYSGPAGSGGASANVLSYTGALCPLVGGVSGGVLIKDFTGIRRGGSATFILSAKVVGDCSAQTASTIKAYASTGNTTSFTADFYATSKDGVSTGQFALSQDVYPGCEGDVNCQQTLPVSLTNNGFSFDQWEPGQAQSTRELWNSNGRACKLVPYNYSNTLIDVGGSIVLKWPQAGSQSRALFRTHVTGRLRDMTPYDAFPNSSRWLFAWEFDANGDPTNKAPALMCLDQEAPRPYAAVESTDFANSKIVVKYDENTKPVESGTGLQDANGWKPIPATGAFEFTLGSERFKAQVFSDTVSGTVHTVTLTILERHVVGTTEPDEATYFAKGNYILSVVMPIDLRATVDIGTPTVPNVVPNPNLNEIARMCVISHGIRMYVPRASTGTSLPQQQYFQFIEFYDGDGWGVER